MNNTILDCDPGHDDALAIIIAANYLKDSLKAITTVAGNTSVDNTTNNALKICSFFGIDKIDIYKGMPSGIINKIDYSEGPLHGKTGIDGFDFPYPVIQNKKEHAVDFLRNLLSSTKSKIDLIATGPLTNLGILFSLAPETLDNINRLIIMGGCIGLGNRTPAAEFNIWADPEAAHIVFNSGIEIKIVPIETTHKVLFTEKHLEKFAKANSKYSECVVGMMRYAINRYREHYNINGYPIHDACAVAVAVDEKIIREEKTVFGAVDLNFGYSRGRTIFDMNNRLKKNKNVSIVTDVYANKIMDLLYNSI